VEIYVTDDRLGGYFRRYQLALRMMSHGARTQTVVEWSKLTRDQLVTQRRRWGFAPEDRQRGPAPSAFHVFFRSRRHRGDAALFAALCHNAGAIIARLDDGQRPRFEPNLENGERFCDALETFREWAPEAELDFEHAMQLARGVVEGVHVTLGWCSDCRAIMLFEGTRRVYANCGFCRPDRETSAREERDERVVQDDEEPKPERDPDHVPERESGARCGDLKEKRNEEAQEHQSGAQGADERRQHRKDG